MKRYTLTQPVSGLEPGTVISGPVADVLAANGKAVPAQEETQPAKARKEGARKK